MGTAAKRPPSSWPAPGPRGSWQLGADLATRVPSAWEFRGKLLRCVSGRSGQEFVRSVSDFRADQLEGRLLQRPVRPWKQAFSPRLQECAIAVENHEPMIAVVEDKNAVARVGGDTYNFNPALASRQFRPMVVWFAAEVMATFGGHGFLS